MKYSLPFQLDNQAFEELAADIFDEVDRRETEQGSRLFLYLIVVDSVHFFHMHFR